jgi:hypothetical protein
MVVQHLTQPNTAIEQYGHIDVTARLNSNRRDRTEHVGGHYLFPF